MTLLCCCGVLQHHLGSKVMYFCFCALEDWKTLVTLL